MSLAVFMADGDNGDYLSFWTKPGTTAGQILLVVGAVLVVGLVIFTWAAVFRKPRQRKHSYHHSSDPDGGGLPQRHKRRSGLARLLGKKRHKRHRRDRPANPTLSQIGGLPPRREEDQPPS